MNDWNGMFMDEIDTEIYEAGYEDGRKDRELELFDKHQARCEVLIALWFSFTATAFAIIIWML